MDTMKSIVVVGSDKELMGMCSQAMSTSREVDVFIEQGNVVLRRTEEENEKDGEKDCEHSAEEHLEQSAAAEIESEKAPSAEENESEKAPSAEENESEPAENDHEPAADESEKDPGNESENDGAT
ncbi:unnamed protein product, partial [Microthlaspi erraticum]